MRILFLLLFLSCHFEGATQLPSSDLGALKTTIESEIFDEEREIWIGLPDNYSSSIQYPVIYVLDAEWRFEITRSLVRELSNNDKCPQHIIVGLPQIDWQHRFKDFTFTVNTVDGDGNPDPNSIWDEEKTCGGPKYLAYIEKEVAHFVNKTYSTNGFNVLMGHSLGGYFAAYVMPQTKLFSAFQIYDPSIWYNGGDILKRNKKVLPRDHRANVFIGYARGGDKQYAYFLKTVADYIAQIDTYPSIRSASRFYEDEFHNSMYMFGVIDGITHLYEGYNFGFIYPDDDVTAEDYKKHYKVFSEQVNYSFSPPKDGFRWIGYANYSQQRWQKALDAYELTDGRFDNDGFYQLELGQCYEGLGKMDLAIKHYRLGLEIDPENNELNERLNVLMEK